jgi:uncharacterized protein YuzE
MRITYDKEANAVYIYFKDNIKPDEAIDTQNDWQSEGLFYVDQNSQHDVLGIEVLNARSVFNEDFLTNSEQL